MAQQITSNNSSLINIMGSTNNNYVDTSSAVNFNDIFNKSVNADSSNTINVSKNTSNIKTAESVNNSKKTNNSYNLDSKDGNTNFNTTQLDSKGSIDSKSTTTTNNDADNTDNSSYKEDDSAGISKNQNIIILESNITNLLDEESICNEVDIKDLSEDCLINQDTELDITNIDINLNEQNNENILSNVNNTATDIKAVEISVSNINQIKNNEMTDIKTNTADEVFVKIADNSTVEKFSDINTSNKIQNQITQNLIDELGVEIVESYENNETLVSQNSDNLYEKLNDAGELQLRNSVENYDKEDAKDKLNSSEELDLSDVLNEVETTDIADKKAVFESKNNDTKITDEPEIVVEDSEELSTNKEAESKEKQNFDEENQTNHSDKKDLKEISREASFGYEEEESTTDEYNTSSDSETDTISINGVDTNKSDSTVHKIGPSENVNNTTTKFNHTINKSNVLSQIHDKIQFMNKVANSKLTMVLNPESLGKVSVQLTNTANGLSAEMVVDTAEVKEILDKSLTELKESLTAQGVNVDNVSVKISESENNSKMDYTEQENSEQNTKNQQQKQNKERNENKFENIFSSIRENENNDVNKEAGEE